MKFLVGYDASKVSEDALRRAVIHAKALGADIYIVRSLAQGHTLHKNDIELEESRLEDLRDDIRKQGVHCESDVIVSYHPPGEDLVKFARQNNIGVIFVGVRKRSRVGKLVFGSTARYVILEAPCPVMSVK
jgi:nucleotide-binding universal stress UspA family protein